MAKAPTIEETTRAIFDAISTYNPRAGEIVPLMGIHMKLHAAGFRADDLNAALGDMQEKGLIEGSGKFIKLTDEGFAAM